LIDSRIEHNSNSIAAQENIQNKQTCPNAEQKKVF